MECKRFITIDTASFLTDRLSINQVLDMLHLPKLPCDYHILASAMGSLDVRVFSINGFQFAIPRSDLQRMFPDVWKLDCGEFDADQINSAAHGASFFDARFDHLRTYITGKGMRWARKNCTGSDNGFDQLLLCSQLSFYNDYNWHFTRIDFAIDVLNDSVDFLKNVYTLYFTDLNSYDPQIVFGKSGKGKVCGRGMHFEAKYTEYERTLYIGSKNSDSVLRVYDKLLESTGNTPGVVISPDDYSFPGVDNNDITSWTRFELQLRNHKIDPFIPEEGHESMTILNDPFYLLYYINFNFAMRTRKNGPLPFWHDYFEIFTKAPILYNGNFVQFREDYDKGIATAERFMASAFLPWLESHCNSYIEIPRVIISRILKIIAPQDKDDYKQNLSYFRRYLSTGKDPSDSAFLQSLFDWETWSYQMPASVVNFETFFRLTEGHNQTIISKILLYLQQMNDDQLSILSDYIESVTCDEEIKYYE